jgi:hypothetical protein
LADGAAATAGRPLNPCLLTRHRVSQKKVVGATIFDVGFHIYRITIYLGKNDKKNEKKMTRRSTQGLSSRRTDREEQAKVQ